MPFSFESLTLRKKKHADTVAREQYAKNRIVVCARDSPLSKAQVEEVLLALRPFYPSGVCFVPKYIKTRGDLDKSTSLRTLEKSDFFTKEIDETLLGKRCDVAIHSAKDLPEPLPKGLKIVALTRGVDPRDVLVFNDEFKENRSRQLVIATSSARREESVRKIGGDVRFVDIRGTIQERLAKLSTKEVDGVVVAEAALIRLKLTHLPRIFLEGESAKGQGQLAVVARTDDEKMAALFHCLDEA